MTYGDPPNYFYNGYCGAPIFAPANDCFGKLAVSALRPSLGVDRLIIGFVGAIGSGKTSAASYLIHHRGYTRGKFANGLKEMLRTFLSYRGVDASLIERMLEGDLKEVSTPYLNDRTPRHAMETLGTEWGRQCIATNLWVDTELEAKRGAALLVFDDVRYANEADAIRNAGGAVVRITRPGAVAKTGHSSDANDLPAMATIQNTGTLADLHAAIDVTVRDLSWALAAIAK